MNITSKDLTKVGVIVNTFGIKGTTKLLVYKNFNFNNQVSPINKLLFYRDENNILQPLKIVKAIQAEPNLILLDFEGIKTINQAELLKNKYINVLKNDDLFIEKPDFSEFHVLWSGESWAVLEVMETTSNALVKVKVAGKKVWIPLVDEYLEKIDYENKNILVKNFERLF